MRIEWTEPALSDMESIREYIGKDSECYASLFLERVMEAVEGLMKFPAMGRRVPEAEDENVREILFQSYRIMYRAEPQRILILAIIHAARDLSLKEPKPWEVL